MIDLEVHVDLALYISEHVALSTFLFLRSLLAGTTVVPVFGRAAACSKTPLQTIARAGVPMSQQCVPLLQSVADALLQDGQVPVVPQHLTAEGLQQPGIRCHLRRGCRLRLRLEGVDGVLVLRCAPALLPPTRRARGAHHGAVWQSVCGLPRPRSPPMRGRLLHGPMAHTRSSGY